MNSSERRLKIYNILMENKTVDVSELSAHFDVSPMTIRRDLAIYEKQGILTTTYGGAYLNRDIPSGINISPDGSQFDDNARKIGIAAGKLLKSGDSVFLDSGDMTTGIVHGIKNLRLTVMTNSLAAANILRTFSKVELLMAPGTYQEDICGFSGSSTIAFIRKYNFDVAVINGEKLDTAYGLTVKNETSAHLKATALDCAKRNIVMIKSDDIDDSAFAQVTALRKINHIVTDRGLSDDVKGALEQRGPQVILAD